MIKHFESIQADPAALTTKLNEVSEFFSEVKFHSIVPTMDNFNRSGVLCIVEFHFETEQKKNLFERVMRPEKKPIMSIKE
jgi:hypothetical protein